MKALLNRSDTLSRRQFAGRLAQTCLGVSVLPSVLSGRAQAAFEGASAARQVPTARNVIYLYMAGGMSHLDTFNAQPGREEAGPVEHIKTSADGVLLSGYLPMTAQHMHHAVILNSLMSTQGAHAQGNYFMHTSYTLRSTIKHPTMGAWMTQFQGRSHPSLPGSVVVTGDSRHPGSGFFGASVAPLIVNNPAGGLQDVRVPHGLQQSDLDDRLGLAARLDQGFKAQYDYANLSAHGDVYRDALKMMKSEDLDAFDINQEPAEMHELYGDETFGQGCLLARRLVEHGVRFVEVSLGGWDTHNDNFVRVPEQCAKLDRGLASLLGDLHDRGLLDETLVVVTTEFGRTPRINQNEGRDHYPKAFSSLLAGGGVRGGQIYGKTDPGGHEVVEDKVSVPDLNATIGYALGLPLNQVLFSPSKRPFTVADKGQPLTGLFG
ncbi:MAG: DUF1501 domain-containing protein [Verrucomicrobiales bacterium]|nr:DUF1501 domain-containing protein [Verrucomicrobiales bacterium]